MNENPKPRKGTFLGIPYDWRWPTAERMRAAFWNPANRRILTPKVFGWGFTINFYEVARRLGLVHTEQ
jgi:hypothetical protein